MKELVKNVVIPAIIGTALCMVIGGGLATISYLNGDLQSEMDSENFQQHTVSAILTLNAELAKTTERVNQLETINKPIHFTITAYTATEEECDSDPQFTAVMEEPIPGYTAAVSQDYKHMLGKKVYINGIGVRRVNDLMNARFTKRIDVLVSSKKAAKRFGVKNNILVVFLQED